MKQIIPLLTLSVFLLFGSCSRKPHSVYDLLNGDWQLTESNVNGIATQYPLQGQDFTMSFYTCKYKTYEWCDGNIFYTFPTPGHYAFDYKISPDDRKIIWNNDTEFEILELNKTWLVTRQRTTTVVIIETWYRLF